ncbi:hypothetical protein NDU88_006142 [Pleurodeles waltl]|uniref:Uncharacterized protein n=1 Tax=Pleurodeles waltl TaxID=8319 RepID=A0AAV7WEQ0_PLEWA|nr:hypothetical protein NDU88_006142 [Pleurodeles waltl]
MSSETRTLGRPKFAVPHLTTGPPTLQCGKSAKTTSGAAARYTSLTFLWHKTQQQAMYSPPEAVGSTSEPTLSTHLTKAYMDNFLSKLRAEIGSLKAVLKSCIHEIKWDVGSLGERIGDMGQVMESRAEDLEALSNLLATLEDQQMDLHLNRVDLESLSRRNNTSGACPREWNAMILGLSFVELLHAIRVDPDFLLPMLDRAHSVAGSPSRLILPPDILAQVNFYRPQGKKLI